MSKPSLVVVLLEDDHHRMLIYRYLKKCGFAPRQIRINRAPSAEGSAEHWVRQNFAQEVRICRTRPAQSALIVVIDADIDTVQSRLHQLDRELSKSQQQPIANNEPIARLIPKRNIETWILCLKGRKVDENADYKHHERDWSQMLGPAAEALHQWARSNADPPSHCVESLHLGLIELRRVT